MGGLPGSQLQSNMLWAKNQPSPMSSASPPTGGMLPGSQISSYLGNVPHYSSGPSYGQGGWNFQTAQSAATTPSMPQANPAGTNGASAATAPSAPSYGYGNLPTQGGWNWQTYSAPTTGANVYFSQDPLQNGQDVYVGPNNIPYVGNGNDFLRSGNTIMPQINPAGANGATASTWNSILGGSAPTNGFSNQPSNPVGSDGGAWFNQNSPTGQSYNPANPSGGIGSPPTGSPSPAPGSGSGGSGTSAPFNFGVTPGQLAANAPASYQQFGAIPYITPTGMQAAQTDYSTLPGAMQQFDALNAQSMQPTFQQQNQALNESLAQRGIFNSGAAVQAGNQLAQEQGATIAGMNAPLVSNFAGYYQQDQLGNTQNQQQANQYNATAANDAANTNAGLYYGITSGNEQNYNNYQQWLNNLGAQTQNTLLGAYLGSYQPAPGAASLATTGLSGAGSAMGGIMGQSPNNFNPFASTNWSALFPPSTQAATAATPVSYNSVTGAPFQSPYAGGV